MPKSLSILLLVLRKSHLEDHQNAEVEILFKDRSMEWAKHLDWNLTLWERDYWRSSFSILVEENDHKCLKFPCVQINDLIFWIRDRFFHLIITRKSEKYRKYCFFLNRCVSGVWCRIISTCQFSRGLSWWKISTSSLKTSITQVDRYGPYMIGVEREYDKSTARTRS